MSTNPATPSAPHLATRLPRFTRAERWIHRSIGLLFTVCLVTAAMLSTPFVSQLVGRRFIVSRIHIVCGLLLPVPILLGLLLSAAFRDDVRRLNRFTPRDWRWLRAKDRRSGIVMWQNAWWPVAWRTGATFVHDWTALGILLLIVGHIVMASRDSEARTGMREGDVDRTWAAREHGAWASEVAAEQDASAATVRTPPGA
jgi:formate dehydrogenase subunit gamma